jgi:hypothetical protein
LRPVKPREDTVVVQFEKDSYQGIASAVQKESSGTSGF